MVEASYLATFVGGVLTLLSPCSALLLPAFFAYAFQSKGELVKKTGIFYLGLATTLVPLGLGISAVSMLFYGQRNTLILVAGLLIIALGIFQLAGGGFGIGPLARLQGRIKGGSAGSTYALGAVYGFAGFCSGPILGAVLTVAAASGGALQGAGLLAVYALGMAAPLFGLALLWDRFDLGRRRWLRGREVGLGRFRVHTNNLVSGLMFVALGVVFIAYEGTSALAGFYESRGATEAVFAAEEWAAGLARGLPIVAVPVAGAVVLASVLAYRVISRRSAPGAESRPRAGGGKSG
ncbi:MAG: cytochrome c biogenesis protein CcdA [Rubrobacter sp.]|nr:cytochrome c biogenesis protein CcdA [Rubrobacter sp.]MDQ3376422.1 cytochrome c biogenesis CcdA family protein [Actinomycetota bacterium]